MRSRVEFVVFISLGAGLGGCLSEGRPWGEVELAVGLRFEPELSRLDAVGRLKTANDFRVELEGLELDAGPVELIAALEGAAGFDPAAPPAGYSLCHNGHCHADDGRLVPYEDIAAELANTSSLVVVTATGGPLSLGGAGRVTRETSCREGLSCEVGEPATVGLVRVGVTGVRVRGRVFEGRASAARVPEGGLPFELTVLAQQASVGVVGAWRFGPVERFGLRGEALIEVPVSLFDAVAWDTMDVGEIEAALATAWIERAGLGFEARRFD